MHKTFSLRSIAKKMQKVQNTKKLKKKLQKTLQNFPFNAARVSWVWRTHHPGCAIVDFNLVAFPHVLGLIGQPHSPELAISKIYPSPLQNIFAVHRESFWETTQI